MMAFEGLVTAEQPALLAIQRELVCAPYLHYLNHLPIPKVRTQVQYHRAILHHLVKVAYMYQDPYRQSLARLKDLAGLKYGVLLGALDELKS